MVVSWDPKTLEGANVVQVDSDASDNTQAIREIDDWAEQQGFVRSSEYWLRPLLREGKKLFRGVCYRISNEEIEAANATNTTLRTSVLSMPAQRVSF